MQQLAQRLPRRSWRMKRSVRVWWREHKRQLRMVGFVVLAAVALLEVGQLLYPADRTLPLVEAGGQGIGGKSVTQATAVLNAGYKDAAVTVKTDNQEFRRPATALGATIATAEAARRTADYPWWQRIIPLSSLAIMLGRDTPVQVTYNAAQLQAFADQIAAEGHREPVDASLSAADGKVRLVRSAPRKDYPARKTVDAIQRTPIMRQTAVVVVPQTTPAPLTDAEAEAMIADTQRLIESTLSLTLEGKETKVGAREIGNWLVFTPDQAASRLNISLRGDRVRQYLDDIQKDVHKAPGTTRVQLIDDREVSRTTGPAGRGVDMDKAAAALQEAIIAPGGNTVALHLTDLPPVLAYTKQYSNTDKALASLVQGIAAAKGGYGISLMELNGRSAYANGDKQFVAASTYKLYVAYAVIQEVAAGRLQWSDMINGKTVAKCFDDMIVVSDNACPKAFGAMIGWSKITTMMHDLGLSKATRLGSAMYTTANDIAYFLYRVENGSIISGADRDRLINAMKRQSYTRAGIPAGAAGTVADKVGDVDGYLHDAAIVYGPQKTYVLVVMTYGGSWAGIADATHQIDSSIR